MILMASLGASVNPDDCRRIDFGIRVLGRS